jgi:hypothetical protein
MIEPTVVPNTQRYILELEASDGSLAQREYLDVRKGLADYTKAVEGAVQGAAAVRIELYVMPAVPGEQVAESMCKWERPCCKPTPAETAMLNSGDYTPEELFGVGGKPSCPKCTSPVLAVGLTTAEIRWAKQHDWYIGATSVSHGLWRVQVRHDTDIDSTQEFTDYQELRNWAGY